MKTGRKIKSLLLWLSNAVCQNKPQQPSAGFNSSLSADRLVRQTSRVNPGPSPGRKGTLPLTEAEKKKRTQQTRSKNLPDWPRQQQQMFCCWSNHVRGWSSLVTCSYESSSGLCACVCMLATQADTHSYMKEVCHKGRGSRKIRRQERGQMTRLIMGMRRKTSRQTGAFTDGGGGEESGGVALGETNRAYSKVRMKNRRNKNKER